ncbi:MAG: hypothetical protein KDA64_09550 [Rhodospirillaceae bacterium]|nr:hypothetical protein [Rhodospirillaceae bacterium]
MSGDKTAQKIDLTEDQIEFLTKMVAKHELPDIGKAVRALIDYAMEDGDTDEIFGEIRCLRC